MQFQKRPGTVARASSPRLDTTEQVASIRLGTKQHGECSSLQCAPNAAEDVYEESRRSQRVC
jgi:hypothetical protein